MVKPPKTMQPESVDLTKAGRGSGKAFQDNSFRNHMARKIDLQRRQFGLVVPPDPTTIQQSILQQQSIVDEVESLQETTPKNANNSFGTMSGKGFEEDSFRNYMARKIDMQRKQFGLVLPPDPRLIEEKSIQPPRDENVNRPRLTVRFAEDVKEGSSDTKTRNDWDGSDMASVLNRLKRKHGRRAARLRRKRLRQQIESSPCVHDETESDDSNLSTADVVEIKPQAVESPRISRPDLFFFGVVVLVNGYTNPDVETLQRLLQKHGGDLEKYETTRVTHIIAEHLSAAKAKIYKERRRPIPVCYPTWITDCVEAGRLIAHANYLIEEVKDENAGKKTVLSFFGKSAQAKETQQVQQLDILDLATTAGSAYCNHSDVETEEITDQGWKLGEQYSANDFKDHDDSSAFERSENNCNCADERKPASSSSSIGSSLLPQTFLLAASNDSLHCSEVITDNVDAAHNSSCGEGLEQFQASDVRCPDRPFPTRKIDLLPPQKLINCGADIREATRPHALITNDKYIKGRIRTVGTDPHFLESFFNSSRLSFIGSYKQRIQKPVSYQERGSRSRQDHRFVFHVDMDCFFASVVLRNYPEYRDKPVAISHHGIRGDAAEQQNDVSKNSTSECATCNYEARKYGITKGMYLGRARELCPQLVVLYYDFEGYEEVSDQVTEILNRHALDHNGSVEQVSCDESYVEMFLPPDAESGAPFGLASEIANVLRNEIFSETQCTASIGVGPNKLLAKLATDKVKPNGSFVVQDQRELLRPLHLRDLHGVGNRMDKRLADEGLVYVSDVWDLGDRAEGALCRILGAGLGKRILKFCKEEDDRPVKPAERKTIGAECNYGVRFDGSYGADHMIAELAKEVERRMVAVGVRGVRVTLKLKQRKQDAKPPPKFLGHGSCHNLSKSLDTPSNTPTRDWVVFSGIGNALFREMNVPSDDIRGMGMVVSRLVFDDKQCSDISKEQCLFKWLEGSPRAPRGNLKSKSAATTADVTETILEEETPRKLSVSFAPTTLLRSFEKDEVIERKQELSPPAASVTTTETSSPFTEMEMSDSSVCSPLAHRYGGSIQSGDTRRPSTECESRTHCLIDQPSDTDEVDNGMATEDSRSRKGIGSGGQSQDCNDVALPSLSQIHMSQVEFLPSPMRRAIRKKVDIARRESTEIPSLDDNRQQARPTTDDYTKARLRQVSVKRMLKLAAVKSKVETLSERLGDSVSLTQLESLPFEMQLQVANNDNLEIGVLAMARDRRAKGKSSIISRNGEDWREQQDAIEVPDEYEVLVINEEDESVPVVVDVEAVDETNEFDAELNVGGVEDARSFFRDNLAPLQAFLDQNPTAEEEAVNHVTEFLCLCVSEHRPRDAVLLLRSIKNRGDKTWSCIAYPFILEGVNERCRKVNGSPLDIDWLGLAPPAIC